MEIETGGTGEHPGEPVPFLDLCALVYLHLFKVYSEVVDHFSPYFLKVVVMVPLHLGDRFGDEGVGHHACCHDLLDLLGVHFTELEPHHPRGYQFV